MEAPTAGVRRGGRTDLRAVQHLHVRPAGSCLAANIAEFRRLYRQGLIYAADRTTDPWTPSVMAVAVAPFGDFYDELVVNYESAIHHYDHVVGPADHA